MMQVAFMVNKQPIDSIPPDYQMQLPPAPQAPGDALLGANYVATTPKQVASGGAGGGGGGVQAQAMEVGTGDEEAAAAAPVRRGEKNLRLMMNREM